MVGVGFKRMQYLVKELWVFRYYDLVILYNMNDAYHDVINSVVGENYFIVILI